MAGHFHTTFSIDGPDAQGLALMSNVARTVRQWAADGFETKEVLVEDENEARWSGSKGTLRISQGLLGEAGFFRVTGERPDGWTILLSLATRGASVEVGVDVYLRRSSGENGLTPDLAAAPSILQSIVEGFECRFEGEPLRSTVTTLTPETVGRFVPEIVKAQNRRIPIILVSENPEGQTFLDPESLQSRLLGIGHVYVFDYHKTPVLSHDLGRFGCYGGAVRVFAPDFAESDALTRHAFWPPTRVRGSRRLIWRDIRDACALQFPAVAGETTFQEVSAAVQEAEAAQVQVLLAESAAASEEADSEREELVTENERLQTELKETQGTYTTKVKDLEDELTTEKRAREDADAELLKLQFAQSFSELLEKERGSGTKDSAAIEALNGRITELTEQLGQVRELAKLREDERDRALRERDELRTQFETPTRTDKHSQRQDEGLLRRENRELIAKIDLQDAAISQKDSRIKDLERLISELEQRQPDGSTGQEEPPPSTEENVDEVFESFSPPNSVIEIVRQLENLPGLRFLKSAYESAEKSQFRHVHLLKHPIETISQCGIARAKGPLGMNPDQWFAQRSVVYAPFESGPTNNKYPRNYHDDKCGIDLDMQPHIKVGGDDLRIHLAWCDDEKKWVIGHCGDHLPTSTFDS